ncbi:ATP-dependent protease ATP-binding subunit [Vibrio alginolyticus 12G01]|nr:ATP-dependent protease ATP-binding subunit [Vibrio alginolyticus 12G01]
MCGGEGEWERKAFAVSRFLVSLKLARMTRAFDLDVVKVTAILNKKPRNKVLGFGGIDCG